MSEHKISATARNDQGKGASRRLRRTGMVPAVIYGGHREPANIQNEWFYSAILTMDIDGATESVLLRDMQRHPHKAQILHLDFLRVSENEAIRASVPLHFVNQDISPAGKMSGTVITHELNEVEVSCLPKDLPEFIEVDLTKLKVGDTIHLSEIAIPAGVEIPELRLGKEHDVAIVVARMARAEVEPTEEADVAPVPASKQPKETKE
jgi:large subunit ribosomal protein L25